MDLTLPARYALEPDPLLGEGGMGRVVRARDVVLDLPVALKLVRPDLASDERFRRMFALEARTSARFTHPHIVPLHDHGETPDGTPYLGLAYADAGSFASLRDAPPAWDELLRLVRQLLGALSHLHARDVLHRDLKPENVLLHTGPDGRRHVWLADLGLANAGADLARRRGRTEGTPGYMAPEQAMGQTREQGPWTDLYAVGVLLWELTTGDRPFADDQNALKAALPPFAPRIPVPSALETVLANVLRAEPLARYDLAADLATELAALGPPDRLGAGHPAPRVGTVAPSLASEPALDLETPEWGMKWNRPLPPPIPQLPPVEPGTGATARASLPLFALRELPLVAREEIRRALWDHARATAEEQRGRVVIVAGEAGSGRTRLLQSVVRGLEEGGHAETVRLSYTRDASDTDGAAGAARALLRPWNETRASLEARLRRRIGRERGVVDDAVRAEAAALARWCGLLEPGEEPAPPGIGLREVHRHLEARRWRGLSCLVLDDVQWSNDEGDGLAIPEALLERWADEGGGPPLLVLVSVRSDDLAADAVLRDRIDALVARGARRIDLSRLDRAATEAIVAESLTLEPALAARVAVRCEGNPLFVRQLLLEWVERGWLVDRGGLRFGLRDEVDAEAVLPRDAGELFRERVASLAAASGRPRRFDDTVHLAALAGRAVPRALIEGFAGHELGAFVLACGLWTVSDDLLAFDSGLLHQALAAHAAQRPDRRYLHRRLGRAYERLADGRDHAFDAGRHAVAAGDLTFGVPLLLRAAETAWNLGRAAVLEEASRIALDTVQSDPSVGAHAGRALLWRARAHEARGEHAEAARRFEAARDALDGEAALEAQEGLAWSKLRTGELEAAEALFSDAVARARQARSIRLECHGIAGRAWVEQQKRNFSGADILFARVLNRCTETSDVRGAAEALLGQAYVARRTGRFVEADELYGEAGEAFREGGDPLGETRARLGLATSHRQRRHDDLVEELLREGLARAEELGATHLAMDARLGLAELARHRGEADRARRGYEAVEAWALRSGVFEAAITAALGLGMLALDAGDLDGAHAHVHRAADRLDRVPGHWLWATYRLVVAALLARRADHGQTWQWLWSAQELGLGDTVDRDTAGCLGSICEVAGERGWADVVRLAAKLGAAQYERLGDPDGAARLSARAAGVSGG